MTPDRPTTGDWPTALSTAEQLADDIYNAGELLAAIYPDVPTAAEPHARLNLVLWLAVERLRQTMQTSASAKTWQSSDAATVAKGQELGIGARPGESMPDYRSRVADELKARGMA